MKTAEMADAAAPGKTNPPAAAQTKSQAKSRGRRNILKGRVVSDKMDKTVSVLVYRSVKHPKYKKYIKRSSVFKAHDEKNQAREGDLVSMFETRPLSKTKRWKLIEILEKAGEGKKQ